MAKKGIQWFNIILAVVIIIAGALMFITFDNTIVKISGVLAGGAAILYVFSHISGVRRDNIHLENEFNAENRGNAHSANENLGLENEKDIKIKNYKKVEAVETHAETSESKISTPEGINIKKDDEMTYSYGKSETQSAPKKPETVASVRDLDTDSFMETEYDTSLFLQEEHGRIIGSQPRKEFEYFVSRILLVLRSLTKTKTAVFAIVDKKSNRFTIESYVTNSADAIRPQQTYEISSGIISKTITQKEAQILSEINPNSELDLLPYYTKHVGALSVAAFPVFGWEGIAGVVCLDSNLAGAYTQQTSKLVDKFTELLSAVVFSYLNKYELLQAAKTLEAISTFYYNASGDINKVANSLVDVVNDVFECTASGVALYSDKDANWVLFKTYGKNQIYYSEGCVADMKTSVLAESIKQSRPVLFNFEKEAPSSKVRICENEPNIESGSFLSVPIQSESNNYGAFYLIDTNKTEYTEYELEVLKTIGYHVGLCLDKLELINILNNSAVMDIDTRMLNPLAFNQRLNDEIQRANDFSLNLVVCLFKIDKYATIDWSDTELSNLIYESVFLNTTKKLRIYDLFGTSDNDVYGVILIDYNRADSKIWAESLRKDTANTILEHNGKKLSVTLSMGVSAYKTGDNVSSVLQRANSALQEAMSENNKVVIH